MKKKWMISSLLNKENSKFFLIAIALIIFILILCNLPKINNFLSGNVVNEDFSVINKENIGNYLEKQNIVKDLPRDAIILIRLYNFNSGSRQWEESYAVKKANVKKGDIENPDLIITMNSKHVSELKDVCSAVKKAKTDGDLSFELKISNVKFLWKYKGMLKYKECLGF